MLGEVQGRNDGEHAHTGEHGRVLHLVVADPPRVQQRTTGQPTEDEPAYVAADGDARDREREDEVDQQGRAERALHHRHAPLPHRRSHRPEEAEHGTGRADR